MREASFLLSEPLAAYVRAHCDPVDPVVADLIAETAALEQAAMQISPEQARFLGMLVALHGARSVLEIGTFTGLSSLAMARRLPPDGVLVACDVSERFTAVARRYWERAGVAERIDLRLGPALDTLATLADRRFDLVFIDADKGNYGRYFDAVLELVPPGGLILVDNVLWSGGVTAPDPADADLAAIIAFNRRVLAEPAVETLLLPTFDGLTMALRR